MCNHVPGEVIAFGPAGPLADAQEVAQHFGGSAEFWLPTHGLERRPDQSEYRDPFTGMAFLSLSGITDGHEIEALSRLSATIGRPDQAIVDLNYYLPTAALQFGKSPRAKIPRLSRAAARWAHFVSFKRDTSSNSTPRPIAILDSGVSNDAVRRGRAITRLGFDGTPSKLRFASGGDDTFGHGSRVASLLDRLLPPDVPFVSAKVGDGAEPVTVLSVASAYAATVSQHNPAVVNLSVAPHDDQYFCPECRCAISAPAFHSSLLRRVIRMADGLTFTVMAAGNSNQADNVRHLWEDASSFVLVAATDSQNRCARYSNLPQGVASNVAFAFGGDGPDANGENIWEGDDQSFGTSFAAPFVSAIAYKAIHDFGLGWPGEPATLESVLGPDMHHEGIGWVADFSRDIAL